MNRVIEDWMERTKLFFDTYGKLISIAVCSIISFTTIYLTIQLLIPGKLVVSFLDIGQGDAILIQTPSGKDMLVDGGPTEKILERLHEKISYFDRDIDVMIATHPDADHVTGLVPVLEKYNVRDIIVSGKESDTGIFTTLTEAINNEHLPAMHAHAGADVRVGNVGDVIDFGDGVTVTVLHPYTGETFKDTNDASISVVLRYGDESFLLTGDLPTTKESMLFSHNLLNHKITVYKAGHHGSKFSSGEQLLSYITPEYAIVSAGKDNTYGHPNREAIARLEKYSKEILSTIDRGTISFVTDGKMVEVKTEK